MRKQLLTLALLVTLATPAAAQVTGTTTTAPGRAIRDIQEQLREQIQAKQEEFRTTIQNLRTEAKTKIEAARAEFQTQLAKIRDEQKRMVASRLNDSLNDLNDRWAKHLMDVVDKLSALLDRIKTRVNAASGRGVDVTAVQTAITAAEKALADAKTAITAQAGKTYSFTVSTDAKLKTDIGKVRQALHADLVKVRDVVAAAREAVHAAAVALGHAQGENATSTGTSTNP